MGTKAQTRFQFWDEAATEAVRAVGNADTTPEFIAASAAKIADQLLKARDERAAFLLQRKPGDNDEKAAKAKALAVKAAEEAEKAKVASDDEDED